MVWSVLTIVVGVYVGLCGVLFFMQRSMIYMPTPATAAHTGALALDVTGATLRVSSRALDGPAAVLYFGGNAEDVAYTVPELAEAFPDRAIYAVHYRGYAGSTGSPSENAFRSDARAVFTMVHARHPDVMVIGRSLGTSLAIQLAAEKPVSRLVLVTPFRSILEIAKRVVPFLPVSLLLRDPYKSWRYAPRVTCPTTIIAASHDEVVPAADTRRLFEEFQPGIAKFIMIEGTDHNSVSLAPEFWNVITAESSKNDR
jgi:pimeloyl-ACP methyl ester carboxylesterase